MNSEGGSSGLLVSRFTACAVSVYCACSSRSSVLVAWMLPVLSSMTKMVPAPSPDRMYLMLPTPESTAAFPLRVPNAAPQSAEMPSSTRKALIGPRPRLFIGRIAISPPLPAELRLH
ncbi:hypothetical protein EYF80_039680 [Liparis tanakae]|uniref:Uncharacterized protein n=1 Tax=Liparis tanakae TaxID=230148 RepID=A0A4Z2G9B3_9TELE|nr:hypothetical protein EYF80_039680 [Liparis tanakae]